ncbi:MAG TPA: MFS transporter [Candidatus Acidoferrales bacterium]|nr:MFS transporter [Candidatus Acidoferrales bacterium]
MTALTSAKQASLKFVVLIGVVSLFADVTYEGARSITGPYLALLGASGAVVGIVAGLGEFVGYGLRLVSGYLSDRTKGYWPIIIVGYFINLLSVPLLALTHAWQSAAALMILERTGKAIRNPPRDAILSHATQEIGHGWGFGLHEALDQTGAMIGPLVVSAVLYLNGSYREGFAVLLVPAGLALLVLLATRFVYPNPQDLEKISSDLETKELSRRYWLYLGASGLIAAGYVDFPLIAYHFAKSQLAPAPDWIPILYAIAMGADALAALVLGRLFDRVGLPLLVGTVLVCAFFPALVFFGGFQIAMLGMILWGIGMGVQESIMRAVIADMVSADRRATAYGIFNGGFGVFWLLGSALMGVLYDRSIFALTVFSMLAQLASLPLFLLIKKGGHD